MQATNISLENINDNQVLERQILDFEQFIWQKGVSIEDIVEVLDALTAVINANREYFFIKRQNSCYYNEFDEMYKEGMPDVFLNRVNKAESKIKKGYSDLFKIVNGCVNSKVVIPGRKSLYIYEILNNLEEIMSLDFIGTMYAKGCKEYNISYSELCSSQAYREIQNKYYKEWTERINKIDDIIRYVDLCKSYAMLNKDKEYKIEYTQEVKVDIA